MTDGSTPTEDRIPSMDHHTAQLLVPRLVTDLVSTVDGANLTTAVPTCPGWDLGKLVRHVGTVYRWVGEICTTQAQERVNIRNLDLQFPSGPAADWAGWLRESGTLVVDALDDTVSGTPVWAWGPDQRVDFWSRRMVHETAIHLADAQIALGGASHLLPHVAADGVDEFLDNLPSALSTAPNEVGIPGDVTIHLHATDAADAGPHPAEWTIDTAADGTFAWSHDHRKGAVAVRGTAEDLYLFAYGRLGVDDGRLDVFGDRDVLMQWVASSAT